MSSLSKILKLVFVALKFNIMRIAVEDHLNARNNLVFQFSDSHSVKCVFSTHFAGVKGYELFAFSRTSVILPGLTF